MNERPSVDRLRQAMRNASLDELEQAAEEFGQQAVAVALAEPPPPERYKPNEEEERQRDLDAALADAIEAVARHRTRLGRRVCSRSDGEIVRLIFEALRRMLSETSDTGFPS
jgi:hypothetical protein